MTIIERVRHGRDHIRAAGPVRTAGELERRRAVFVLRAPGVVTVRRGRRRRFIRLLAALVASVASLGWMHVDSGRAAAHGDIDGLALSRVGTVRPARAVHLPPLRVPLRPLPEPPDDGADGQGAGPEFATTFAPTPLQAEGGRSPQAARDAPAVGGKLDGLGSSVVNPADVQLAVGPSDVVEMVNAGVDVWSKTGSLETSESLGQYFSDANHDRRLDGMTDPRVLYDTQSSRWFATVLDMATHQTVMVISSTPQLGSGTWVYSFPSPGCPDQPRLGMSDTLVAFGDNLFSDCVTNAVDIGGEVTILDKSALLTGATADESTYGPDLRFGSVTPVTSLSSTGTLYLAASDFVFHTLDVFSTSTVQAGPLTPARIPVSGLVQAPDAPQSDPALINTGDNRVQNAVWENGTLWLAISIGCLINGESGVYACGRYLGINTATMTISYDAASALDQGRDLFYPAIMPASDGTIYTVFGYSSASETPGIGVLINPGPAASWGILTPGTGANESGRWGDYFGIARDPSDPTHVWVAAAYGTGGDTWSSTAAALGTSPFSIAPVVAPTAPTPTPPAKPKAPPPPAWLLKQEQLVLHRVFGGAKPQQIEYISYPKKISAVFEFSHVVVCGGCSAPSNASLPRGRVIRVSFDRSTHVAGKAMKFCSTRAACLYR